MLFALAAIVVTFVVVNTARQRSARREDNADERAALQRRARVRELRGRTNDHGD